MRVPSLGREDPLEEGMATHSSILAWRIQRTEEPGGLPSMGPQRVRHDWACVYSVRFSPDVIQFPDAKTPCCIKTEENMIQSTMKERLLVL